ncbi:MAG: hypothetical protein GEV05_21075 [Betaproteobacteria bacterium]|nr:hypothetical protein [Betaproteobacteria bacterium]
MTSERSPRRLHIERLDLDMRGIPPATAEAAVRALGPALAREPLAREFVADAGNVGAKRRIDAGRLAASASPEPGALAAGIAQRIAASLRRSRP